MTDKKCLKCGYEWTSKVADPKKCPRCNQPLHPYIKPEPEAKPSEILMPSLIYCPFCGAKLPIYTTQTMPIPEKQPSEIPTEEEHEEEPSERGQPSTEQPEEESVEPTEPEEEEEDLKPRKRKPREPKLTDPFEPSGIAEPFESVKAHYPDNYWRGDLHEGGET